MDYGRDAAGGPLFGRRQVHSAVCEQAAGFSAAGIYCLPLSQEAVCGTAGFYGKGVGDFYGHDASVLYHSGHIIIYSHQYCASAEGCTVVRTDLGIDGF